LGEDGDGHSDVGGTGKWKWAACVVCVSTFHIRGTCGASSQEENAAVVGVALEILFQLRADLR